MSLKAALLSACLAATVSSSPLLHAKRQGTTSNGISTSSLPDYSPFSLTAFVPFSNYNAASPKDTTPTLQVKFESGFLASGDTSFHDVPMDTGSTGYTFDVSNFRVVGGLCL